MGFQCVPQILGLVHGDGMRKDGKGQAKHRANVAAIVNEAFEIADQNDGHPLPIRKSASETYDRSRTVNNKYTGYQTADDVLAALEEEADKQRVEVAVTDKKTGETVIRKRALPSTTVLGVAVIFNPPSEIAKDWSPEQYDKFFRDCEESLAQIPFGKVNKNGELVGDAHYLFRRENIIASAEHWDEGEAMDPPIYTGHIHDVYKPEDLDGKYYGKFIDALNLSCMVNRRFAGLMRERGWDIDDPDYTDWDKADKDKEYKAKRKSKIRTGGKSTNSYIASKKQKDAEVALAEAQELLDKAVALQQGVMERAEVDAEAIRDQARAGAEALLTDAAADAGAAIAQARSDADATRQEAADAAARADRERERAESEKKAAEADRDAARQEAADAQRLLMSAQMAIPVLNVTAADLQDEISTLEQSRNMLRREAEAAQKDRDAAQEEADELRRNAVAQAEREAQTTRDRIEAEAREAWEKWLDRKKKWVNDKAAEIIKNAQAKAAEMISVAAEAAQGEYAFLLKWLGGQKYQSGRTFLEAARRAHKAEIHERRVSAIPPEVRDVGRGPQTGAGRTCPGE